MATYNVQPETNKIIKEYAERVGKEPEAALDALIQTAASRKKSLQKYAAENPRPAPRPRPRRPRRPKAPKGTSLAKKKAPKAKKAPKVVEPKTIPVV